ncbi:unnamed protein product [Discosporangium mesarthrocarpum]
MRLTGRKGARARARAWAWCNIWLTCHSRGCMCRWGAGGKGKGWDDNARPRGSPLFIDGIEHDDDTVGSHCFLPLPSRRSGEVNRHGGYLLLETVGKVSYCTASKCTKAWPSVGPPRGSWIFVGMLLLCVTKRVIGQGRSAMGEANLSPVESVH